VKIRAVHILAIGLLALSSCADHFTDSGEAAPGSACTGTILAIRPVRDSADRVVLPTPGVLLAVGERPDTPIGRADAVELIVRTESGGLLSVIQARDTALRPGDKVRIVRGARTFIAPP
jgi:outer membrane lipoprotein SlyB